MPSCTTPPVRLRCALLCALLAVGWLVRFDWPPRFLPVAAADPIRSAFVLMFVLNGLQMYVFLVLRRFLSNRVSATNPGQYLVGLAVLFATGVLANGYLLLSGVYEWHPDSMPTGPYLVMIAYPMLSQLSVAVLLIALGYGMLRSIQDRDTTLRWYAYTQIAAGIGLSSLVFARLAALAMGVGHLILAAALWEEAGPVHRPRVRHAIGHIKPI